MREVLQLLHVLDNPLQDTPFLWNHAVFFGGFEEEEAALIRSRGRGEFLYETCRALEETEQEEKEGRRKLSGFLAFLEEYRIKARYTPIHKLIQDILTRTGYLEYVCAKPSGEQRCANVEMLLTKAAALRTPAIMDCSISFGISSSWKSTRWTMGRRMCWMKMRMWCGL